MRLFLGIVSGFASGLLSGAFGLGGAVISTPAVRILLGAPPIVAVGTTLPAILPTTLAGAVAYRRAGFLDLRAARTAAVPGAAAAIAGAGLSEAVNAHLLLIATAVLMLWQAGRVVRQPDGAGPEPGRRVAPSPAALAATGAVAGFVSGLLGIGGGIVLVPAFANVLRMPIKEALGTSLVVIAVVAVPGTIVHAALGHVDWSIFLALTIGVVPGALLASRLAVRAPDRLLRLGVGISLAALAIGFGALELQGFVSTLRQ